MKTPGEIKKSLEACGSDECHGHHTDCHYDDDLFCTMHICGDARAYIQQLEHHIGELTEKVAQLEAAQPKWISVEDRLPEREVLAANFAPKTYGYKEYIIGYVSRGTEPGKCYAENDYEILYNVTHWMPLPDAPKE